LSTLEHEALADWEANMVKDAKGILIIWFGEPREQSFVGKLCRFSPENREFVIGRKTSSGQLGFITFDIKPHEDAAAALEREGLLVGISQDRSWREIVVMTNAEHGEVTVGDVQAKPEYWIALTQSVQCIFDWRCFDWLEWRRNENLLDPLTSQALTMETVRLFLQGRTETPVAEPATG
jgi:hypothetical protein